MGRTRKRYVFILALIITLSTVAVYPAFADVATDQTGGGAGGSASVVLEAAAGSSDAGAALKAEDGASGKVPNASIGGSAAAADGAASTGTGDAAVADASAGEATDAATDSSASAADSAPVAASAPEASSTSAADKPSAVVGTVDLGDGSSIAVEDVAMLPGDDGNVVAFTLNVKNGSDTDLQFINYWVHLESKSGNRFSVTLRQQDQDKNRIPAATSQEIHFYSKVSPSLSLQDLQFRVIEWDFSQPDFESTLGIVGIPGDFTNLTPAGGTKTLSISGTPVQTGVTKLAMNSNDKYNLPVLTFNMENIGAKSAVVPGYQFFIRTSEGLMYPLNAAGLSKDLTIFPRFSKEIQLSGSLPVEVGTDGWELLVTQTDEAAKLTLPVAYYRLAMSDAEQEAEAVSVGKSRTLDVDSSTIDTSVEKVLSHANDKYVNKTVYFTIKNTSAGSLAIPKYQFSLLTGDGLTYPMTADDFDKLTVDPLVSKEIQLHASIPVEANAGKAKLIVSSPPADPNDPNGKGVPLAYYELPADNQDQLVVGDTSEFSDDSGLYGVKLNSIQRLPWQDQDILAAGLALTNPEADSLPIPELTGKFVLDGSIEVPVQTIRLDDVIGIRRNGKVNIQLFGMIPYTYQYSTLKLVLQEKTGDKTTEDLMDFEHDTEILPPQFISVGDSYKVDNVGNRLTIAVNDVRSYEDVDSHLMSVLLNVQNLEKRDESVPNLVAYFKTSDEVMYKADISQVKNKLGPRSVATLFVSANIPEDVSLDDLQLIVGVGVAGSSTGNGSSDSQGTPVAYVSAATFALPAEKDRPQTDFTDLQFSPFTVSLSNFKADIVSKAQFRFSFDYQVSKSSLVEAGTDEHKLLIEFKDPKSDVSFTQELAFGANDGLPVGEGTKEIVRTDEAVLLKLPYMSNYEINIYDEFKGLRKLLASQSFSWFN